MSTRVTATLCFEAEAHCCQLHLTHDGEPAAVAEHLRAMLRWAATAEAEALQQVYSEAYEGALAGASYHYTFSGLNVRVAQGPLAGDDADAQVVFSGPLLDFLAGEPGPRLHLVALPGFPCAWYFTLADLRARLLERLHETLLAEASGTTAAAAAQREQVVRAALVQAMRAEGPAADHLQPQWVW